MKRTAFTMIELIFVIVILGILASVAIPKLSATKDDASLVQKIANTKTCINDLTTHYLSQGSSAVITDLKSCSDSINDGVSISYSGDNIIVSSSGSTSVDGNYTYKGTRVVF